MVFTLQNKTNIIIIDIYNIMVLMFGYIIIRVITQ